MAVAAVLLLGITAFFGVRAIVRYQRVKKYENKLFSVPTNISELPQLNLDAQYLFNPDDKNLMSGFSDYIAAAAVEKIIGISYGNVRISDNGLLQGTPYTHYVIKILHNIKGRLRQDISIPLIKYGGVTIDGKNVEQLSPFLEEGKGYVIYFMAAETGKLYLNKSYALSLSAFESDAEGNITRLKDFSAIEDYVDAYLHEDTQYAFSDKHMSMYDVDFEGEIPELSDIELYKDVALP